MPNIRRNNPNCKSVRAAHRQRKHLSSVPELKPIVVLSRISPKAASVSVLDSTIKEERTISKSNHRKAVFKSKMKIKPTKSEIVSKIGNQSKKTSGEDRFKISVGFKKLVSFKNLIPVIVLPRITDPKDVSNLTSKEFSTKIQLPIEDNDPENRTNLVSKELCTTDKLTIKDHNPNDKEIFISKELSSTDELMIENGPKEKSTLISEISPSKCKLNKDDQTMQMCIKRSSTGVPVKQVKSVEKMEVALHLNPVVLLSRLKSPFIDKPNLVPEILASDSQECTENVANQETDKTDEDLHNNSNKLSLEPLNIEDTCPLKSNLAPSIQLPNVSPIKDDVIVLTNQSAENSNSSIIHHSILTYQKNLKPNPEMSSEKSPKTNIIQEIDNSNKIQSGSDICVNTLVLDSDAISASGNSRESQEKSTAYPTSYPKKCDVDQEINHSIGELKKSDCLPNSSPLENVDPVNKSLSIKDPTENISQKMESSQPRHFLATVIKTFETKQSSPSNLTNSLVTEIEKNSDCVSSDSCVLNFVSPSVKLDTKLPFTGLVKPSKLGLLFPTNSENVSTVETTWTKHHKTNNNNLLNGKRTCLEEVQKPLTMKKDAFPLSIQDNNIFSSKSRFNEGKEKHYVTKEFVKEKKKSRHLKRSTGPYCKPGIQISSKPKRKSLNHLCGIILKTNKTGSDNNLQIFNLCHSLCNNIQNLSLNHDESNFRNVISDKEGEHCKVESDLCKRRTSCVEKLSNQLPPKINGPSVLKHVSPTPKDIVPKFFNISTVNDVTHENSFQVCDEHNLTIKEKYSHICAICRKRCSTPLELLSHQVCHSSFSHKCALCDEIFKNFKDLSFHQTISHPLSNGTVSYVKGTVFASVSSKRKKKSRKVESIPKTTLIWASEPLSSTLNYTNSNPKSLIAFPSPSTSNSNLFLQSSSTTCLTATALSPNSCQKSGEDVNEGSDNRIDSNNRIQGKRKAINSRRKKQDLPRQGSSAHVEETEGNGKDSESPHPVLSQLTDDALNVNSREKSENSMLDCEPASSKVIECKDCVLCFVNLKDLLEHRRSFHGESNVAHVCELCKFLTSSERELDVHVKLHSKTHYSCPICPEIFSLRSKQKSHSLIHSKDYKRPKFTCEHCNKVFYADATRQTHQLLHLPKEKTYKCSHCDQTFTSLLLLKKHVNNIHDQLKPFTCETCYRSFASFLRLHLHKEMHLQVKRFTCEKCGIVFNRAYGLRKHMANNCN